ncbi:MAG: PDZ domain-containing protein [Acidobacteriales bacterium]|nr:PDZ domain-containing protein [Terriglobales bacterium]
MSTKAKIAVLTASALILIFMVVGGLDGVRASSNDAAYKQLEVYSEVISRVRGEYVEDPNIPAVTSGALHGLLESLDPNSSFLTPAEYKEYQAHKVEGKGEIGAIMSKRFGYAAVVSVIPGSPAEKAGLQSGDIMEAIEGKSTRELSVAEIRNLLAGQPGSSVSFAVVRARKNEPQKMTVTRAAVTIPPVADKMMEDGVGYIQVDALTPGKAQEIATKIKALQKSGAKRLILDLRNSASGEESEGVAVANLFLNHGTIAYVQGQKYPRQGFNADPSKAITNLPVAVLVNKGTAGAAEIVAAALLENARADVIGDKTFGEGSIQKLIAMPDGSALILSIAKYYSPSGKAIQDSAVTPNVLVAETDDDAGSPDDDSDSGAAAQAPKPPTTPQQDEQLQKALQVLKSKAS